MQPSLYYLNSIENHLNKYETLLDKLRSFLLKYRHNAKRIGKNLGEFVLRYEYFRQKALGYVT